MRWVGLTAGLLCLTPGSICSALSNLKTSHALDSHADVDLERSLVAGNQYSLDANDTLDSAPKRWISVPELPDTGGSGSNPLPWPPLCPLKRGPTEQWLQYCFVDDATMQNLFDVLAAAIARWSPTSEYSSLRIMPDMACGGTKYQQGKPSVVWDADYRCVCSNNMKGDSLMLRDTYSTNTLSSNAVTTLGYDYSSNKQWRHYMKFGALDPDSKTRAQSGFGSFNYAVETMTHELGHAMGLLHEHQRLDRDQHIDFYCKNLAGYNARMKTIAAEQDPAFTSGMSAEERMAKICTNNDLAKKYLPVAISFMTFDKIDPAAATYLQTGTDFDARSIMIYGSDTAARKGAPANGNYVLVKKQQAFPNQDPLIYDGGHPDPELASISVLDIVRIAQLYPKGPDDAATQAAIAAAVALKSQATGWGGRTVTIPGLVDSMQVLDSLNHPAPAAGAADVDAGVGDGNDAVMNIGGP